MRSPNETLAIVTLGFVILLVLHLLERFIFI
jgi:hypothetical protein